MYLLVLHAFIDHLSILSLIRKGKIPVIFRNKFFCSLKSSSKHNFCKG